MMQNENSIEYEIAHRQLVMRDAPQESIFTYIISILEYYDLPSIFGLITQSAFYVNLYRAVIGPSG